ncbi:phage portal protein [Corynebacterium xerosis]|nr:phage portal protein [Corynebacterium xerosis]
MKLSKQEMSLVTKLEEVAAKQDPVDRENLNYYLGKQLISFLGLRLREEWLQQAFPLMWCRTLVQAVVERQNIQRLLRRGVDAEDEDLRRYWDESDMGLQFPTFASNLGIYGRAVLSVSVDAATGRPRMVVEPVRAITLLVNELGETLAALRRYYDADAREVRRVLYLPDETIEITGQGTGGLVTARYRHGLGRVPVVMAVMHDVDGKRTGSPVFEPIKRLADTSAETMLNARVALETQAAPQKVLIDTAARVVDQDGNEADVYEAFYDSMLRVFSPDGTGDGSKRAQVQQLAGADMSGFFQAITTLGQQAASATGLPMRMFGHVTANPPSETTVRGEEARLVRLVELHNQACGAAIGWALSIADRLDTGVWPEHGAIDVSWRDPGTPTEAQHADAITKYVQTGVMSKRSALEELGWSDTRIKRELERLREEAEEQDFGYRSLGRGIVESDVIDAELVRDA